ncbi:MAG: hypothetical protein E7541_00715 [Ruminococcaceae bacterium]|nr:hypothetical protein [Oscillospiraceae bacterium]
MNKTKEKYEQAFTTKNFVNKQTNVCFFEKDVVYYRKWRGVSPHTNVRNNNHSGGFAYETA